MKNTLYIFLSLIIVSCAKDDDTAKIELTDPLIGVWLSEGTIEEEDGELIYTFTLTYNSDNTGSSNVTFSFDGESEIENELLTWENKDLDFTATSQTYNIIYAGEEYGNEEKFIFSDDFKTLQFDGDDDEGINPFIKQ
tara:strand:+ start:455 stop:868 length:414 start_codon:yes stop_codon:yes gene_type:complete